MRSLPFVYKIRRSNRAKYARIVVKPGQVEVVAPHSMSERTIRQLVSDKQSWVSNTLDKIAKNVQSSSSLAPDVYTSGVEVPFQGKFYKLLLKTHTLKRVKVEFTEQFIVTVPKAAEDDCSDLIRVALIKWMHTRAEQEAQRLLQKYSQCYRLYPRSIRIKTQKSRWGSCGIHDDIYLNWVLMLAPEKVFEYVFVHEICHIKHRNHSQQFWNLVAKQVPDWQTHRNWLGEHGAVIMKGL